MPDITTDKTEIEEIQRRFALAVDGKDFAEIRRIFVPDGLIRFGGDIPVDQFIGIFTETQKVVDTQHFSINSVSVIEGDRATSTAYYFAYHHVPPNQTDDRINQIYGHYPVETDLFQGGIYNDELIRTDEGWRLHVRAVDVLWSQTLPSHTRKQGGWAIPAVLAHLRR